MKSLKDIVILIVLVICVVFVYKYYNDKQQIKLMELRSNSLQFKIDSINKIIAINEQKILSLNNQVQQNKDSIFIYKQQLPIIRKIYDTKYKEIDNYTNIDIYNEFICIFSENNIR